MDEGYPDSDGDGIANCVDDDDDGDTVPDALDNCPTAANPGQENTDGDKLGDECDPDDDDDGLADATDNCPTVKNANQTNTDGDNLGDACDPDDDNDGALDDIDNCAGVFNPSQTDFDQDTKGDACDTDDDNDGWADTLDCKPFDPTVYPTAFEACNGIDDNCNFALDEGFADTDNDSIANCVDSDDDNDGDPDESDCAPLDADVSTTAKELCQDAKDNNCNGQVDEVCGLMEGGWATMKRNARRTSNTWDSQTPKTAALLWKKDLGNWGFIGSPAVPEDGSAVYAGLGDELFALDPDTGDEQWKWKLEGFLQSGGGPTLRKDGTIIIGGGLRLDAVKPDGTTDWSKSFAQPVSGTATISDAGIIYQVIGSKLHAFTAHGIELWKVEVGNVPSLMPQQHPALGQNGFIYVSGSSHTVSAVNSNGQVEWTYTQSELDTDGSPAVGQDGRIYQAFSNKVVSLTTAGVPNWTYSSTGGDTDNSVAIFNTGYKCCNPVDRILVSSNGGGGLVTITYSGAKHWQTPFQKDGGMNSTPAIDTDGDVLIGADDGKVRLINQNGTVVWSFNADHKNIKGTAALALNRGYIGDNSGTLYCFGE